MTNRTVAASAHAGRLANLHGIAAIVAVALTLAAELVGAAWWASSLSTRMVGIEESLHANGGVEHRLSKIETRLDILIERRTAEKR